MKFQGMRQRALTLALVSASSVLVLGCASYSYERVEASQKWARETIVPLLQSQPGKAAELTEKRMQDMCHLDGGKLGTTHFGWILKGTGDEKNRETCENLALIVVYARYKQGTLEAHAPYLSQVFYDRAIRRTGGWKDVASLSCSVYDGSYDYDLAQALGSSYSDASQRVSMPSYYELLQFANPEAAEDREVLYKHYLCRLSDFRAEAAVEAKTQVEFVAEAGRVFGEPAALEVRRYLAQVYQPLVQVEKHLGDYRQQQADGMAMHYAKRVVLYENALRELSAVSLAETSEGEPSIFKKHLNTILNEGRESLRLTDKD